MTERAIEVYQPQAMSLPDRITVERELAAVKAFQLLVRQTLIDGHDYGVIPGTNKPTLLKPGAEKIAKLLGLADTYEILSKTEDWKGGFFAYEVRAILTHRGEVVSTGLGECNSMEAKYRWRWLWPDDVPEGIDHTKLVFRKTKNDGKQYRVENDDIYSQVNTLLKMAKKRALVDAALSASRLSDIFTQDIEDLKENGVIKEDESEPPLPENAYFCPKHKTVWFMRGKMKAFAHPVEGTKDWCSMPVTKPIEAGNPPEPPTATTSKAEATPGEKKIFPKVSQDRVDQLSRALTAAGYLPGEVRQALLRGMKIEKLEDLDTNQGNLLEAFCKRKEAELDMKLPFEEGE